MNDPKLFIAVVIALIVIVCGILWFFRLPSGTQLANLKEYLKYAVIEAEAALGSGTGQLKLRYAYDLAITKFPWVAQLMTFELFSKLVDEALEWAKEQLDKNKAIAEYVEKPEDKVE